MDQGQGCKKFALHLLVNFDQNNDTILTVCKNESYKKDVIFVRRTSNKATHKDVFFHYKNSNYFKVELGFPESLKNCLKLLKLL